MPQLQYQKIEFATCLRVPVDERNPDLHYYDVSHEDDSFRPAMIAKHLWVNHLGTIAVKKTLEMKHNDKKCLILTEAQKDAILRVI
ncbi:LPD28 domain-containing protein [Lysinibacillus sphaericus]|uniref:LPD28 domain-containing protein n=1 Tax=Lysinibacillus sphaericus TaxID=1421 RepID=UPI003F7B0760